MTSRCLIIFYFFYFLLIPEIPFKTDTAFQDVKCSGNWMWAAKLPGEGSALYEACQAMCKAMCELGIAIDGGKDSLSMAARVGSDTVKAPGMCKLDVCVWNRELYYSLSNHHRAFSTL